MIDPDAGDVAEGWMRFWGVFGRPWPVVIGFALADIMSRVAFTVVVAIAKAIL